MVNDFKESFLTIDMAKVSTSAEEARDLGFLRQGDSISMNNYRNLPANLNFCRLRQLELSFADCLPLIKVKVMHSKISIVGVPQNSFPIAAIGKN